MSGERVVCGLCRTEIGTESLADHLAVCSFTTLDFPALDAWLAEHPITDHQQVEVVAVHVNAALLRSVDRRRYWL